MAPISGACVMGITLQVFVESGEMRTWTHLQYTDWHGTMLYFQRQSGHCFIFT